VFLVRSESIRAGMRSANTISTLDGRVLLTAGTVLRESYIEPLLKQGVAAIYVVNELAPDVVPTDVVAPESRRSLNAELRAVLAQVAPVFSGAVKKEISRFKIGLDTERLTKAVGRVVDDLLRNPQVVFSLQDIRTSDEYTLGHSVNVCILATLLGTVMQYTETELKDLAVGAVLHDVGKVATPPEILNKPAALTPEEFAIMKQHTTMGWQILSDQNSVRPVAAIVALQHHERWSGEGYPRGLGGEQIYKHSRICAVADCYDAMISDRVYRPGMAPGQALEIIAEGMGGFFQPGLGWSFAQCVAPYPVGSLVQITGGRQAVVVAVNRGQTYRPRIRVVLDKDGRPVPGDTEIKLDENPDIRIIRMVREQAPEFSLHSVVDEG